MAETPVFESPITKTYPAADPGGLTLGDESAVTKLIVRAAAGTGAEAQLAVPFGASRATGDVLVVGQRPGEWLLVGPAASVAELADGLDTNGHVSLIDHTHSRAMFRLTGAEAARVLAKVCSLDLADLMTPDGAVVSGSVAKTNCDLVRQDVDGVASYRIACDRSFGQYLFDAVLDAGEEFGLVPQL